jgi:hypothetical protein
MPGPEPTAKVRRNKNKTMQTKNLFNAKIPFSLAMLIIMVAAVYTEQLLLDSARINNAALNSMAALNLSGSSHVSLDPIWLKSVRENVALSGVNIPLVPGAQRLTFNRGSAARYRVNAPANLVTAFYRQILASRGWRNGQPADAKQDRLSIALAENPLSGKTDITYTYVSPTNAAVLGVKIAEANMSAPPQPGPGANYAPGNNQPSITPAPGTENPPQQPMQPPTSVSGQYQPQPNQPMGNDQTQPIPNQYQPQPGQPMSDGQMQPMQPMNQPTMNQMEFNRQPMFGDQGGNQTCRVNGVDMPGSCEQYNNQKNQGNQMGRPGQMNQGDKMGRQGPSEEEMKKMEEQRFKDMKRGLSQFSNGAKQMKKSLAKVKTAINKCGVNLPEELTNALAQTDNLVEKIKAAQTADELDEIISDVQDVGSVMQDWGPRMGDLNRICQMIKQADRDAKQFDRNIKRLEAQVKANKKVDLSELLAEYKTAVAAQKDVLAQVKELAKTDPDEALAKIEDDFYGNMDNLGNLQMQIDTIINIGRGIKDITRELINFTSQIKALAKKKIDTADLQTLLDTLKTQAEEIKNMIKEKVEAEELVAKVEEMFDARQQLQDLLQEYDVIKMIPQIKTGGNFNVKVNLPEAFKKAENNNGDINEEQPASSGSAGGSASNGTN